MAEELIEEEPRPLMHGFVAAVLALVFLSAGTLIAAGLFLPAFRIESFWVFQRDVTILGGIQDLAADGQMLLGWLLLLLSVLIPIGKTLIGLFITMNVRASGPMLARLVGTFEILGKLSFVDVFVIALLVIVLDGRVLTRAELGPGIYAYGVGVALSWLATVALSASARKALG